MTPPVPVVAPDPSTRQLCAACGVEGQELKACSRCTVAKYCGKACQTSHWRLHKTACPTLASEAVIRILDAHGGYSAASGLLHDAVLEAYHGVGVSPSPPLTTSLLEHLASLAEVADFRAISSLTLMALAFMCVNDPNSTAEAKRMYAQRLRALWDRLEALERSCNFGGYWLVVVLAHVHSTLADEAELVAIAEDLVPHVMPPPAKVLKRCKLEVDPAVTTECLKRVAECMLNTNTLEARILGPTVMRAADDVLRRALAHIRSAGEGHDTVAYLELLRGQAHVYMEKYQQGVRLIRSAFESMSPDEKQREAGLGYILACALCMLRRLNEAKDAAKRSLDLLLSGDVTPPYQRRWAELLLCALYDISYLVGEHSEAYRYAEQGMQLTESSQGIDSIYSGFLVKASDALEALGGEPMVAMTDATVLEALERSMGEPLKASNCPGVTFLTYGFATRRCRHFMSLGGVENLDEAEGWARIAVARLECLEGVKYTRWVHTHRKAEPLQMLVELLEAKRDTLEADKVTAELQEARRAEDEVRAAVLKQTREVLNGRGAKERGRKGKKGRTKAKTRRAPRPPAVRVTGCDQAQAAVDAAGGGGGTDAVSVEEQGKEGDVKEEEDDDVCSLCLDPMIPSAYDGNSDMPVCLQQCGHAHHDACLDYLIQYSMEKGASDIQCPLCRAPLLRVGRWRG